MNKIFLANGKYEEPPMLFVHEGSTEHSKNYVVVANGSYKCELMLLQHLRKQFSRHYWEIDKVKELSSSSDINLETRLKVLGEVFEVIR